MALNRENLTRLLAALSALVLLLHLDRLHLYALELAYLALYEVDFWTYLLVFAGLGIALLVVFRKYQRNAKVIKKLGYVHYLPVDEYERQKREITKKALAELARDPKYLELKARLERERREGVKTASPPLTEDEDSEELSASGDD